MTTCPICGTVGYQGLRAFECELPGCQNFEASIGAAMAYEFPIVLSTEDGSCGEGQPRDALSLNDTVGLTGKRAPSVTDPNLKIGADTLRDWMFVAGLAPATRDADGKVWVNLAHGREELNIDEWEESPSWAGYEHCVTGRRIDYDFWSRHIDPLFAAAPEKLERRRLISAARVAQKMRDMYATRFNRIVAASGYETGSAYMLDHAEEFIKLRLRQADISHPIRKDKT